MLGPIPNGYPTIVLAIVDTARTDAFDAFGAKDGSTPVVRRMARKGAACLPLPTPVLPRPHTQQCSEGARRQASSGHPVRGHADFRAAGDCLCAWWLSNVLHRDGYSTVGASANILISEWGGSDRGFGEWVHVTSTADPSRTSASVEPREAHMKLLGSL